MCRGSEKRVGFKIKHIIILTHFVLQRTITTLYRFSLYPYKNSGLGLKLYMVRLP